MADSITKVMRDEYVAGRRLATANDIENAKGSHSKLRALLAKRGQLAEIYEDDGALDTAGIIRDNDIVMILEAVKNLPAPACSCSTPRPVRVPMIRHEDLATVYVRYCSICTYRMEDEECGHPRKSRFGPDSWTCLDCGVTN